jgi:hypothetical protein
MHGHLADCIPASSDDVPNIGELRFAGGYRHEGCMGVAAPRRLRRRAIAQTSVMVGGGWLLIFCLT